LHLSFVIVSLSKQDFLSRHFLRFFHTFTSIWIPLLQIPKQRFAFIANSSCDTFLALTKFSGRRVPASTECFNNSSRITIAFYMDENNNYVSNDWVKSCVKVFNSIPNFFCINYACQHFNYKWVESKISSSYLHIGESCSILTGILHTEAHQNEAYTDTFLRHRMKHP
jgi:hypothetical protein